MKVFLIGANGQLGTDLLRVFRAQGMAVISSTHLDLDVRDADAVSSAILSVRPGGVVSTAASHRVDECEERAALAFEVNALGRRNLAQACERAGCALVHFSTDYVFDGRQRKPYNELDLPRPLNVYGASKLAGEHLVAGVFDNIFLFSTHGPFVGAGRGGQGADYL